MVAYGKRLQGENERNKAFFMRRKLKVRQTELGEHECPHVTSIL